MLSGISSFFKIPLTLSAIADSDFTFYERDGVFLWREKSSLTKERVKTVSAFAKSRRASAQFGRAAELAKQVYWSLPKKKESTA